MNMEEIMKLDSQYYMNTFGERSPVAFTYGENSTLYDKDGKSYIDFLSGIAVNCLGYRHEGFLKAVTNQLNNLIHCSNLFYIEPQAKLAKLLVENSCGDRAFFANSGAEANEGAIKLARKYFKKKRENKYEIITAKNSFHGRTLATIAATGQEKYQKPFQPLPTGFINVEFNHLPSIERAIGEKTCAIMLETIQGEGGVVEADKNYLKGIRQLCDEKGILLILDEVQTGMGRTGKLFSYEHYGIEPDIFTLAKALGNGIPIGALIAKEHVASAFEPGDHGTTFGGNPLACAAGLFVTETMVNSNIIPECAAKGEYFKKKLYLLKDNFPFIKDVRGKGLLLGLELDPCISGKQVVRTALEQGFIINCAAHNTLRFAPPLIITVEEIDLLINKLHEIFSSLKK